MNRMSDASPASATPPDLGALADQCVMCGLCLPACPTYRVARTEAESPRGRIALARALANGELAPQGAALAHLDHCLGCLSCERACPSGVQYGRIIDASRAQTAAAPDRLQRLLYFFAARPRRLQLLARLSHGLGLHAWLANRARRRPAGLPQRRLGHWLAQIPPLPALPARNSQAIAAAGGRGRIGLFLGCVASAFDRDTHAAARQLLQALGFSVVEPPGQACCGALARHAGHLAQAQQLAAPTREAFTAAQVDTVLVSASGCLPALRDHTLAGTSVQVREISEFLAADPGFAALAFDPLPRRAALHLPCSLDGRGGVATKKILQHIPELDIVELPVQPRCCGAAGTHFLRHPQIALPLRDERIAQVRAQQVSLLLTSNIGCRLHLDSGLRAQGAAVEVLHPVTLLARQLKAATPTPTAIAAPA
jgi:glycolate oxidase iron-sulfur subunit